MSLMQEDIKQAIAVLQAGGVILYPTDTVWGIGCDATNKEAVKKVFEIKQRIDSKALIVLLDSMSKLQAYVQEVPDLAWDLHELSTTPLTIIYQGARNLAPNLVASDGSIAIRITQEEFSRNLCMRFKKPIVSTSANISGEQTPAFFSQISSVIKEKVDYICTTRQDDNTPHKSSSIIKLNVNGEIKVIR